MVSSFRFLSLRDLGRCLAVALLGTFVIMFTPMLIALGVDVSLFFTALFTTLWIFLILVWAPVIGAATLTGLLVGVFTALVNNLSIERVIISALTGVLPGFAVDYLFAKYRALTWKVFVGSAFLAQFLLIPLSIVAIWPPRNVLILALLAHGMFSGLYLRIGVHVVCYLLLKTLRPEVFSD